MDFDGIGPKTGLPILPFIGLKVCFPLLRGARGVFSPLERG